MSEKEKAMSLKIRGAPHLLGVGQITIEVGGEDITNSIKSLELYMTAGRVARCVITMLNTEVDIETEAKVEKRAGGAIEGPTIIIDAKGADGAALKRIEDLVRELK